MGILDLGFYKGQLLPSGLDGAGIEAYRNIAGWDYEDIAMRVSAAVSGWLQRKVNEYGWSFSISDQRAMRYANGARAITRQNPATTQSQPRYIGGAEIGHALPLINWEPLAIAFTDAGGELLTMYEIDSAIRNMIATLDATFDYEFWRRKLTNTEDTHELGVSAPFANGTTGSVDFRPMPVGATSFPATHTHYLANASRDTLMNNLVSTLLEHNQQRGEVFATISRADFGTWADLDDFAIMMNGVLQWDRGGMTSGPQFAMLGMVDYGAGAAGVVGGYRTNYGLIAVRASDHVPTNYVSIETSYGSLNPMNSLCVSHDPRQTPSWGPFLDLELARTIQYPYSAILVKWKTGVGVKDRVNGAAGFVGSTWANPSTYA